MCAQHYIVCPRRKWYLRLYSCQLEVGGFRGRQWGIEERGRLMTMDENTIDTTQLSTAQREAIQHSTISDNERTTCYLWGSSPPQSTEEAQYFISGKLYHGKYQEFFSCTQHSSSWSQGSPKAVKGWKEACPLKMPFSSVIMSWNHMWNMVPVSPFRPLGTQLPLACLGDWQPSRWLHCGQRGRSLFGNDLEVTDGFPSSQRRGLLPAIRHSWMALSSSISGSPFQS